MSFTLVDQLSEISRLLDKPFNRPEFAPDFPEVAWEEEFGSVHERVFECLQRAEAAMTGLAEEAFSMGAPFGGDRKIGVVVTYIDLLSADLLHQLQRILADIPKDYLIYFDGDDRDAQQFYVTITKREIIGYAHNPKSLSSLDFRSQGE